MSAWCNAKTQGGKPGTFPFTLQSMRQHSKFRPGCNKATINVDCHSSCQNLAAGRKAPCRPQTATRQLHWLELTIGVSLWLSKELRRMALLDNRLQAALVRPYNCLVPAGCRLFLAAGLCNNLVTPVVSAYYGACLCRPQSGNLPSGARVPWCGSTMLSVVEFARNHHQQTHRGGLSFAWPCPAGPVQSVCMFLQIFSGENSLITPQCLQTV